MLVMYALGDDVRVALRCLFGVFDTPSAKTLNPHTINLVFDGV